jgi:hypothetical protein
MKTGGSIFLWSIIIYLWFKRFSAGYGVRQSYVRSSEPSLTFEEVTREFERVPPAREPSRDS